MFLEVFLKNFLVIFGKVLIFKFFRVESFFKVFSGNREHGVYGGFGAFFCSGCLSLGFPLEFRYISVLPPMILRSLSDESPFVLRSIFDRSSIPERSSNGG